MTSPHRLPASPRIEPAIQSRLERDYERFAADGPPGDLEAYLLDEYRLDVAAEYAGVPIPNPWGKASGQLSMTARQVADDVNAGLGFVVLKTVIAQDETGGQSMAAWAIPESRMVAERITGSSGEEGWTISWKGRGWWQTFEEYLQLIRDARDAAAGTKTLIVPSCKFHLPTPEEPGWKVDEYRYTVARLLEAWRTDARSSEPMPLEKDFSPTLAGSDLAQAKEQILEWLRQVPLLVKAAAAQVDRPLRLGLKVFNALFDDDFQLEMLHAIHAPPAPGDVPADFFIYGNRLFDPHREFDGHTGIAYGGPDLSDRNLRVLSRFREEAESMLPLSATGNVTTGRMAVEYALRGATSFQLHTFFQLPADQYRMTAGTKTEKALHELLFHPQTGFIPWLHHVAAEKGADSGVIRFLDIPRGA